MNIYWKRRDQEYRRLLKAVVHLCSFLSMINFNLYSTYSSYFFLILFFFLILSELKEDEGLVESR